MVKLAVIGICGNSMFMKVNHFHQSGETVCADSFSQEIGGKGINQAIAAARMGAKVSFLAAFGDDDSAEVCIRDIKSFGVEPYACIKKGKNTPLAVIMTDSNAQNRVTVFKDACLDENDVYSFEDCIAQSDILLLQNEVPEAVNELAAKIAKKYNVKVVLNPAPERPISDELAKAVFAVTPNEHEAQFIDVKRFENCITTLGSRGCSINDTEFIPATKIKAVDTTGAGDTFNGVLCVCIAEGMTLKDACRYAVCASGLSVSKSGVVNSIPQRTQVEECLKNFEIK